MKYVKKLILCLCVSMIAVISFVEPVSAVDFDEYGRPIWSDEELKQFGAIFEPDGSYYFPVGTYHPDELYSINSMLVNEPYFPSFDIYKLPWDKFPYYVQAIRNMNLDGYDYWVFNDEGTLISTEGSRLPIMLIIVDDPYIEIYAGVNLSLGMRDDKSRLCLCSLPGFSGYADRECYYAKFKLSDYSIVTDWVVPPEYAWGNSGAVNYYNRFPLTDYEYDVYIYGASGFMKNATTSTFALNTDGSSKVVFLQDPYKGYMSGRYFSGQSNLGMYYKYFTPPTAEELQAHRQEQINDALNQTGKQEFTTLEGQDKLDDFNSIGDDVTSIFAPSDFDLDVDGAIDDFGAFDFVWGIFDSIVKADASVFSFFISALALGVVILILNR